MTATPSIELPAWMAEQLSQASPDLTTRNLNAPSATRPLVPG
jgi:hypothetical protein